MSENWEAHGPIDALQWALDARQWDSHQAHQCARMCIYIYVYIHIYVYIYIYMYIYLYKYIYIYIYLYICIYIYISMYIYIHIHMCVSLEICTYKFVHLCNNIYVYTYAHKFIVYTHINIGVSKNARISIQIVLESYVVDKMQVIFRKRATNYRALLRKETCTDKACVKTQVR